MIEVAVGPGPRVAVSDDVGLLDVEHNGALSPDGRVTLSGIGLKVVAGIMRLHKGGTLDMSVEPARSTTMRLDFAATRDAPSTARKQAHHVSHAGEAMPDASHDGWPAIRSIMGTATTSGAMDLSL